MIEYSQSEASSQLEDNNRVDDTPKSAQERLEKERKVFGDSSEKEAMKRKRALQYEMVHGGRVIDSLTNIEKDIEALKGEIQSQREERQRWRTEFNQQTDFKIQSTLNQNYINFKNQWEREKRDIINMVGVLSKGKEKVDNKLDRLEEKLESLLSML